MFHLAHNLYGPEAVGNIAVHIGFVLGLYRVILILHTVLILRDYVEFGSG